MAAQFDVSLSFGGTREWVFETRKNELAGKVYDSVIHVDGRGEPLSLALKATATPNASAINSQRRGTPAGTP